MAMSDGTITQRFSYDAQSRVVAVDYSTNGGSSYTTYYYLRNAQGDIVKLIDGNKNTVVEYTYDSWGKLISTTGDHASGVGSKQPFRYRGYVYDTETGWYYLQSRYYNPTVGRFISSDIYLSTGQGVIGHNSYAYCNNSPLKSVDSDGRMPKPYYSVGLTDTGDRGGGAWTIGDGSTAAGGIGIFGTLLFLVARLIPAAKTQPNVEPKEKTNKQYYFPTDPALFNPKGLVPVSHGGTYNGKIIKWMIPGTKTAVFEWNEDFSKGSHYHILLPGGVRYEGEHYKAGDKMPEPWNTMYFN